MKIRLLWYDQKILNEGKTRHMYCFLAESPYSFLKTLEFSWITLYMWNASSSNTHLIKILRKPSLCLTFQQQSVSIHERKRDDTAPLKRLKKRVKSGFWFIQCKVLTKDLQDMGVVVYDKVYWSFTLSKLQTFVKPRGTSSWFLLSAIDTTTQSRWFNCSSTRVLYSKWRRLTWRFSFVITIHLTF